MNPKHDGQEFVIVSKINNEYGCETYIFPADAAGVASQQVTLGISTEQARWLGRYVGGQIKLTVEVVL